jgi:anaerobic selenocysteine-containing dehydrogenase
MPVCRSACPYDCPDGCSLLVEHREGRITRITGDPANPFTGGLICGKMAHLPQAVHSSDRILTPLRRNGPKGSGRFAPISWDQALEEISGRWRAIIDQYGPAALLPCSYAGTMGAVQRNGGEAFFHALGATRLVRTLCSSGKSAGWEAVMGRSCDLPPSALAHSDFIILWSTNLPATRLHLLPLLKQARARGARVILIDVYESPSARLAQQSLLVQPGSDGALALSLLQVLHAEGLTDEGYLAAHTTGWPELAATLDRWTPEATQAITGLPPHTVRELARAYAAARTPVIVLGSGFSRSGNGGEATRAIAALPAAIGAWARPGAGTYGVCSSPDLVDKSLIRRPDLAPGPVRAVNINQLGAALKGELPGGPVMGLYVYHCNPAAVLSDQNAVLAGLAREDLFTVVHERTMTDTARYADLILPAPYMVETEDLYTPYGYRGIQYVKPVLPPVGQVKSNWEVFTLLAAALGLRDPIFSRTAGELCRMLVEESSQLTPEQKEQVLAGEPVVLESPFPLPVETADGKIHLSDPAPITWYPPHGGPEPLKLVCAPAVHTLNSSFQEVEDLCRLRGVRRLRMNREDAAARGISHGDAVVCCNDLGQAEFTAALDRAVAPGTVVAEGVYEGEDSVNSLTHARLSDLGEATTLNDNTVQVYSAAAAPLFPKKA